MPGAQRGLPLSSSAWKLPDGFMLPPRDTSTRVTRWEPEDRVTWPPTPHEGVECSYFSQTWAASATPTLPPERQVSAAHPQVPLVPWKFPEFPGRDMCSPARGPKLLEAQSR